MHESLKENAVLFAMPLNTSRVYTMVTDNYGTKIYLPCERIEDVKPTKLIISEFLSSQPEAEKISS